MPQFGRSSKESSQISWFKVSERQMAVLVRVIGSKVRIDHILVPTLGDDLLAVESLLARRIPADATHAFAGQN